MTVHQSLYRALKLGRLLYADRGLIVVNKGSGLVCQSVRPRPGVRGRTGICDFDQLLLNVKAQLQMPAVPIQVHRLDKLTTGALLFARTPNHARDLHRQLRAHDVKKTYLAIVRSGAKTFEKLGRKGIVERKVRVGDEGACLDEREGDEAVTEWEVLGSSEKAPLSLLRLTPLTGRKHQLRLHLSQVLQCPILGDTRYSLRPPLMSILELLPRNIDVVGLRGRASFGNPEGASDPTVTLTRKEQKKARKSAKILARRVERSAAMFLHSAHVSLHRYTPSSGRRIRLGITAPLSSTFLSVCDAADLRQYVPETCVVGGLDIDGQTIEALEVGSVRGLAALDAEWFGT